MNKENATKKQILVAEDDPVSCRILAGLLLKWNYEVSTVTNGTDALRILESESAPRLAVLDWMMPGVEGVEICQRIRQRVNRPYTYILLLTARTEKKDILQGLELGADDYLTKPFDALELRARLHVGERILDLQDALLATQEDLRFQATHDELTGIFSRGVVIDVVSRECSRQTREKGTLGIIMADLDHFKNINDTYGHASGDAVLKEVARRMKDCVRPYDTVGRYGGEEFLIVATSLDASGAFGLAERIRKAVESRPVTANDHEVPVTVSLGVAVSSKAEPPDPQILFNLADKALYRAKELGRNRSELAESSESASSEPCVSMKIS
ncbi:MAG: diguanylate cyclase [Candidatus Acidiferrum sp.]